jgi:hypothetical protein
LKAVAARKTKSYVRRGDSMKITTTEYFKPPPEKEAAFDAPKQSKRRTVAETPNKEGGNSNALELHLVAYVRLFAS